MLFFRRRHSLRSLPRHPRRMVPNAGSEQVSENKTQLFGRARAGAANHSQHLCMAPNGGAKNAAHRERKQY